MYISTKLGIKSTNTQPAAATLADYDNKRLQTILTCLSGGPFYVKFGTGADDGVAGVGGTWDFILDSTEPPVVIDNYRGILTCDPAPAAGDINVSALKTT